MTGNDCSNCILFDNQENEQPEKKRIYFHIQNGEEHYEEDNHYEETSIIKRQAL